MTDINAIRKQFFQMQGMKKQVENDLQARRNELMNLNQKMKLIEQAQVFLQKVAQDTQSQLKLKIEDIVNLALNTVFPDEYLFQVDFNVSRGKTDAELVFVNQKTNGRVDPMTASGGGVVDIVAFALRIAGYVLESNVDNVIILDEPFRFVSKDLVDRAGEILKVLSTKLGLQIIMVTHIPEFIDVADKVFRVRKNQNGVSKII